MRIAAIDIGTSSTRALLFDGVRFTGESAAVEYALKHPEPGAAELGAMEVMDALVNCVRSLTLKTAGRIDCVALSSAMHSLIAVDAAGAPLTPVFTWADNRAAQAGESLRATAGGRALYLETGVPIHAMSPLVKLIWLRATRPGVFACAAKFVSIKEFVVHQLFGRWMVDDSIASASGLYALARGDWSDAALAVAGLGRRQLSALAPPTTMLSGLSPGYGAAMNLPVDTRFMLGASDGCLANLGAGVLAGGGRRRAVLTIGTSGALRMAVPAPATDPAMRTFCYVLDRSEFVIGGATNGGGLPLRWLRDNFPQLRAGLDASDPYTALADLARTVPAGAGGLLFHPYLAGERAPLWNAAARASFIGLNFGHGPAHLVRAVMEGVLFNLSMILDVLEELSAGPVDEIVAGGGFAHSPFWLQMAADLFGRTLAVADNPESTAQGAALMAMQALGQCDSLAAAAVLLPPATRRVTPDAATHARYAKLKPIFAALPAKLAPFHAQLTALQRTFDQEET